MFILICTENLKILGITAVTKNETAEVVIRFFAEAIVVPLSPLKTFISENAACFNTKSTIAFMTARGITWKKVLAYDPMLNGRAKRKVGSLKKSVGKLFVGYTTGSEKEVHKGVYGFRRRPMDMGRSPLELLYSVLPRPSCEDPSVRHSVLNDGRTLENLETLYHPAEHFKGSVTDPVYLKREV